MQGPPSQRAGNHLKPPLAQRERRQEKIFEPDHRGHRATQAKAKARARAARNRADRVAHKYTHTQLVPAGDFRATASPSLPFLGAGYPSPYPSMQRDPHLRLPHRPARRRPCPRHAHARPMSSSCTMYLAQGPGPRRSTHMHTPAHTPTLTTEAQRSVLLPAELLLGNPLRHMEKLGRSDTPGTGVFDCNFLSGSRKVVGRLGFLFFVFSIFSRPLSKPPSPHTLLLLCITWGARP